MAQPIEVPFELWARLGVGPKKSCIRWEPDPLWEGAILRGKGQPIVKYRDALP